LGFFLVEEEEYFGMVDVGARLHMHFVVVEGKERVGNMYFVVVEGTEVVGIAN